jgi:hypothetical protein
VPTDATAAEMLQQPLREPSGAPIVAARMLGSLRAIAEALFATAHAPAAPERIDWLLLELEDFLARAGARTRLVLRLAVLAVSLLAPLGVLRFTPLRRLPLPDRIHALRRLENGPLAAPLFAVKALLSLLYYEHPEAAREIGFDGECQGPP